MHHIRKLCSSQFTYLSQRSTTTLNEAHLSLLYTGGHFEVISFIMNKDRGVMSPEQTRKIFLGGINPATSEDFLKDFFSKYGDITDCCVIKTSGPEKKSRGFGFVTFVKTSSVDEVMDGRPSTRLIIDNREVEIKRAISREDPAVEPLHQKLRRKVFVGGIRQLTEETIAEFFLQFGKIEETVIPIDKSNNNKKRGFAFVVFTDAASVKEVVAIQNHTIDGVVVECKRATPQEKDMPRVRRERGGNSEGDETGSNFSPIGPKSTGFNRGWGGGGGFPGGFSGGNNPGFGPGGYGGAGWGRGWGGWGAGWGGAPGWGTGGSGWGYNAGYGSGWGGAGYGGWGTGYGGSGAGGMGAGGMGAAAGSGAAAGGGGGGSGGAIGAGGGGFGGSMLAAGGFVGKGGSAGGGGGGDRGDADFGSNYGSQSSGFGPMRSQTNGSSGGRFIGPTVPYGAPYGSGGGAGAGSSERGSGGNDRGFGGPGGPGGLGGPGGMGGGPGGMGGLGGMGGPGGMAGLGGMGGGPGGGRRF